MTDARGADPREEPRSDGEGGEAPGAGGAQQIPDLVGTLVAGRYRVLELLGRGAMGAVYLARHERMGRRDALKILPRHLAADPDALARFSREARNASFIRHPNVCDIYDFGETEDGLPFLAMEYVEGETLGDLLEREGPLSPEVVVAIGDQVTRALEAAHGRGIVHRDLKPDNIMLTHDLDGSPLIKVVDFGIAKVVEGGDEGQEVTRAGWVVGTPEYVSPEQLAGGTVDARSDLYSLAIVLFRALTGELPFQGETWREIMTRRLTDPPRRLLECRPDLPHARTLQELMDRALSREPGDRQADAEEFRRELLATVRGSSPPGTRTVPPPTRDIPTSREARMSKDEGTPTPTVTGDGSRRRIALFAGGAALVLAALTGVGVTFGWFGDSGSSPSPSTVSSEIAGGRAESPSGDGSGGAGASTAPSSSRGSGPSGATGTTGGTTGAGDATGTGDEAGTSGADRSPPPSGSSQSPSSPTDGGTGQPSPVDLLAPDRANETLFRQLAALSEEGVSHARAVAARDTAGQAWERTDLDSADHALAAYVTANALQGLQGPDAALPWARRAVDLAPDNRGFQDLLHALQGANP